MSDTPEARRPGEKITDGANDRSREAPIGQSAGGLPDDSGRPVEAASPEAERAMEDRLRSQQVKDPS